MAWERMTNLAVLQRSLAEALFAQGATPTQTAELLNLKRHTAFDWRDLYLSKVKKTMISFFDKASQRLFIAHLMSRGYGYKYIANHFDLDLWFVRDTGRTLKKKGLLAVKGGSHE